MNTKAFLFDMDGVIIDSEHHYDKTSEAFMKSLGHKHDRNIKLQVTGLSNESYMQLFIEKYGLDYTPKELEQMRKPLIDKMYAEDVDYIEGFEVFYKVLIEKHPLPTAIVTGCGNGHLAVVTKRLGLNKHFKDHIYSTHNLQNHKPHPDGYLYAAQQLGVEAKECIVFEDAPLGVISALRAGAKVVAVTFTFTKEQIKSVLAKYEAPNKDTVIYINEFNEESLKKIEKII